MITTIIIVATVANAINIFLKGCSLLKVNIFNKFFQFMIFKVNISKIAAFDDAIVEICEKNGLDKPDHMEINSDDSPNLKITVSDTFIARISRENVKLLKRFS